MRLTPMVRRRSADLADKAALAWLMKPWPDPGSPRAFLPQLTCIALGQQTRGLNPQSTGEFMESDL